MVDDMINIFTCNEVLKKVQLYLLSLEIVLYGPVVGQSEVIVNGPPELLAVAK